MGRFLVLLFLVLTPVFPAFALTIDEAVSLAIENSYTIKQQQENVNSSKYAYDGAFLIYAPSVGLTYDYAHSWNKASSNASRISAGQSTASAYLKLNIFNGLNDSNTVDIANLSYSMAGNQLITTSHNVTLNAQNAFINVLRANSTLQVALSNVELLKLQKRDAELSAANGLIAKTDVLQIETYLASAELQRISAESSLNVAIKTLENVINRPIASNEMFVEPIFDKVQIPDNTILKDMMYTNRSDLKYLEQSYLVSKKNENTAFSGVYPKLDLSAGYYRYGDDLNAFQGLKSQGRYETASIGITASWNLLNIAVSRFSYMSKKKTTQATAYAIADTKQAMGLELDTALANYENAQAQLTQAKIGVQYAEENYRVQKSLYDQTATTQTDLLNAAQALNQAKLSETTAVYAVIASIYSLERIVQEKFIVNGKESIQPDNISITPIK